MGKPKRSVKNMKKHTLAERWLDATWIGFDHRSHEHLVALAGSGPVLKVRTVRPRPVSER